MMSAENTVIWARGDGAWSTMRWTGFRIDARACSGTTNGEHLPTEMADTAGRKRPD
jgi:hypothetical protein